MALKRVWIPSPNYSSRGGAAVRLVVLHTAEGALTYQSLGNFFASSSAGVSSQVGIDDTPNTVGEYVSRSNKSWTQGNFNPASTSAELCAFSAWDRAEWDRHPTMLDNTAKWVAEECAHFGIPITRLNPSQAQGSGRGVCMHVDLGSAGGGHWDCGDHFPLDRVLDAARSGAGIEPTTEEGEDLITSAVADNGAIHVFWVGEDGKTVWYRYQRKGETDWNDGGTLLKSNEKLAGLSATTNATGTMELFGRTADGNPVHTWQRKGETAWHGGEQGKSKAAFTGLPK
ncbi:MAG TPA: N-acetylmuramoyl-L-alanine amidase [Casimicrobiaceae bacterium]|jgi:hypothetical protein